MLIFLSSLYKVFCCHEIMRSLGQLLEAQMYALQTGGHCQKHSNNLLPVNNHGYDIFTLFIFQKTQMHYLMFGSGFQTWEYSPKYAIRSYAYVLLHTIPGKLQVHLFEANKVRVV